MTKPFPDQARPRIGPLYRMQWEEAQKAYVLLYPEGMVTLNDSAGEVLRRCDGTRTVAEIITDLKHAFPDADLEQDVLTLLTDARDKGWVCAV
jgi:pyrroloquinoline quinone biosynthesis protein D